MNADTPSNTSRVEADPPQGGSRHGDWCDPGALCASALAWADRFLDNEGRALASSALTSVTAVARRHPAAAIAVGMGGIGLAWLKLKSNEEEATLHGYATARADHLKELALAAQHSLSRSGKTAASHFSDAASSGLDAVRERYSGVADSLGHESEKVLERARQLGQEAQLGFRKARKFASDEPGIAVAGGVASGVALALGSLLVARLLKK